MAPTLEFEHYVTPDPSTTFSHQYFVPVTFEKMSDVKLFYPTILGKGSIKAWTFSNEIHVTTAAMTIRPCEMIPHYEDICGIIDEMPVAHAASARSVCLSLTIPGKQDWVVFYHFSKVCPATISMLMLAHIGL